MINGMPFLFTLRALCRRVTCVRGVRLGALGIYATLAMMYDANLPHSYRHDGQHSFEHQVQLNNIQL